MKDKPLDVEKIDALLAITDGQVEAGKARNKPVKTGQPVCPNCGAVTVRHIENDSVGARYVCDACNETFGIVDSDLLT